MILQNALRASTWSNYRRSWTEFANFCSIMRASPYLPTVDLISYFMTHLFFARGLAPATISSTLSALSYVFSRSGIPDVTQAPVIRGTMVSGIKNISQCPDVRLPFTEDILRLILAFFSNDPSYGVFDRALLKAMVTLGFYACLRPGEMTFTKRGAEDNILKLADVAFSSSGTNGPPHELVITFGHFKHAQSKKAICLRALPAKDRDICPLVRVIEFLAIRGNSPGYLFEKNGRAVHRDFFAKNLKRAVSQSGLNPARYTPHSLRIGGTTALAGRGASDAQIRAAGRWRSDAWKKYIRTYNT